MNPLVTLLVLLLIPVGSFGVSTFVSDRMDSQLQAQIRRQLTNVSAVQLRGMSVATLCGETEVRRSSQRLCQESDVLRILRPASAITGVLTIVGILGIIYAGSLARGNRNTLLRIFEPGLSVVRKRSRGVLRPGRVSQSISALLMNRQL